MQTFNNLPMSNFAIKFNTDNNFLKSSQSLADLALISTFVYKVLLRAIFSLKIKIYKDSLNMVVELVQLPYLNCLYI